MKVFFIILAILCSFFKQSFSQNEFGVLIGKNFAFFETLSSDPDFSSKSRADYGKQITLVSKYSKKENSLFSQYSLQMSEYNFHVNTDYMAGSSSFTNDLQYKIQSFTLNASKLAQIAQFKSCNLEAVVGVSIGKNFFFKTVGTQSRFILESRLDSNGNTIQVKQFVTEQLNENNLDNSASLNIALNVGLKLNIPLWESNYNLIILNNFHVNFNDQLPNSFGHTLLMYTNLSGGISYTIGVLD